MRALRRYIGLEQAVLAIASALIIAFAAILIQSSLRSHRQIVGDAEARADSILRSAESSTTRTLVALDAALSGLARTLALDYAEEPPEASELELLLRQTAQQAPPIRDIHLLDESGQALAGTAPAGAAELIEKISGAAPSPRLAIGHPVRSGDEDRWSILVGRPVALADGLRFILAAEVPIHTFCESFAAAAPSNAFRIALLAEDGTLIAGEPRDGSTIGSSDTVAASLLPQLPATPVGSFALAKEEGGEPNLLAYRRIADRPLILAVTIDQNELLQGWRDERRDYIVIFAMIAATIISLSWGMLRLLRRRQQHLEELRRNETKFVQQSALLQSTLEHMGEGLSVFDRNHRLLAWNDRFLSLLELPSGVGYGTRFEDILRLQARRGDFGLVDIEAEVRARIETVRNEIAQSAERTTLSGRILEIRRRRMPAGGFVTIYSDVTERHRFEQEMIDAKNQAEIANRAKGEFLANMSHELRTPLNAVIGFSDILRHEKFGAIGNRKYVEYAHDIHNSGLHLLDLISDVLDMSKIEAGKMELFEEEIVLSELVASCLAMVRERARERQVRIATELGSRPLLIWADMRAMKQVLLNILSNAVKFSHDGGAISITAELDGEGSTIIQVSDAGIGMSEEQIARAREPFGQAHAATTRRYGGTGLGLPITQRLVEMHGGAMQIMSRPGEGTTVAITLPAARSLPSLKWRA